MLVAVWMSQVSASPPSPYYWSCIAAWISLQEDLITLCLQASSFLRWGKGCEHLSLLKKIEVNPTVIRPGKVGLKCVIFKRWPDYKRRWCPHCKSMINRYLKQLEREKSWLQSSSRAVLSMAGLGISNLLMQTWTGGSCQKWSIEHHLSSGSRCLYYSAIETRNRYIDNAWASHRWLLKNQRYASLEPANQTNMMAIKL